MRRRGQNNNSNHTDDHHTNDRPTSEWVQDKGLKDTANRNEFEMNEKRPLQRTVNGSSRKVTNRRDPLHWFGLLVSPSLRSSQDHFKTGKFLISYVCACAIFIKIIMFLSLCLLPCSFFFLSFFFFTIHLHTLAVGGLLEQVNHIQELAELEERYKQLESRKQALQALQAQSASSSSSSSSIINE